MFTSFPGYGLKRWKEEKYKNKRGCICVVEKEEAPSSTLGFSSFPLGVSTTCLAHPGNAMGFSTASQILGPL